MPQVLMTETFSSWFNELRDRRAKARIQVRLDRLRLGLMGDVNYFDGIGELRIDYGPGYRLYFVKRGSEIIVLLCGGDKGSQDRDIRAARKLAQEYEK